MTYGPTMVMLAFLITWAAPASTQPTHLAIEATFVADWTDDDPLQTCTDQQHVSLTVDQLIVPQSSNVAATVVIKLSLSPNQLREAVVMSAAGLHLTMQRTGEDCEVASGVAAGLQ